MVHVLDLQVMVPDDVSDGVFAHDTSTVSQTPCVCLSMASLLICSNAPI
jgi:hypothetical protein